MTTNQPAARGHLTRGARRAGAHPLAQLAVLVAVVVVCSGFTVDPREWMKDAVDSLATAWAGDLAELAESMLLGAFDGSLGTLGAGEWSIATMFTGRLGAVMGIFAVAFCIIEVVAGTVGRDPMRIAKGAGIAVLAWPMTATAAWVTIQLTTATDRLATLMLADTPADVIAAKMLVPVKNMTVLGAGGMGMLFFAVMVLVPTALLSLVMAFRSFALLIAVAFAPVALMTQGWSKMRGMARGWATIVGALVITKPLAAGIVVICLELIDQMPDAGAVVMGAVGLWMAAFAPAAAAGLFGFAGGEVAAAQGAASAQAGRQMVGVAKAGGKFAGKKLGPMLGGGISAGAGAATAARGVGLAPGAGGVKTAPHPAKDPAPGGGSTAGGSSHNGASAGGAPTTASGAPASKGAGRSAGASPTQGAGVAAGPGGNGAPGSPGHAAAEPTLPAPGLVPAAGPAAGSPVSAPAVASPPAGAAASASPTRPGPGAGGARPGAPAASGAPVPLGGSSPAPAPPAPGSGAGLAAPGGVSGGGGARTAGGATVPGTGGSVSVSGTGAPGAEPSPSGVPGTSAASPSAAVTPGGVRATTPHREAGAGVVDGIVTSVEQQGDTQ